MTTMAIERVVCDSIEYYPGNAKVHDIGAITESLTENGLYKPLVVQESTRYCLAGNGTLEAALSLGWSDIDVVFLDCDDARAKKINLADNRIADLGSYDTDALAALLTGVDDLIGTGYSADDLARLVAPLPEGFQELDVDAPAPAKQVICPSCGTSFAP